ncbi:MAG: hypothetical protein R3311_03355 [Oceanisphaera sp.]|nr:hypothetical protein [Oceanisphaera sp.]
MANSLAVTTAVNITDPEIRSRLRLCHNSLTAQNITAPSDMQQMSAAILYLAERQQQGWSYIRT